MCPAASRASSGAKPRYERARSFGSVSASDVLCSRELRQRGRPAVEAIERGEQVRRGPRGGQAPARERLHHDVERRQEGCGLAAQVSTEEAVGPHDGDGGEVQLFDLLHAPQDRLARAREVAHARQDLGLRGREERGVDAAGEAVPLDELPHAGELGRELARGPPEVHSLEQREGAGAHGGGHEPDLLGAPRHLRERLVDVAAVAPLGDRVGVHLFGEDLGERSGDVAAELLEAAQRALSPVACPALQRGRGVPDEEHEMEVRLAEALRERRAALDLRVYLPDVEEAPVERGEDDGGADARVELDERRQRPRVGLPEHGRERGVGPAGVERGGDSEQRHGRGGERAPRVRHQRAAAEDVDEALLDERRSAAKARVEERQEERLVLRRELGDCARRRAGLRRRCRRASEALEDAAARASRLGGVVGQLPPVHRERRHPEELRELGARALTAQAADALGCVGAHEGALLQALGRACPAQRP